MARSAGLAQLAEHLSCKEDVAGSIPAPGSTVCAASASRQRPGRREARGGQTSRWLRSRASDRAIQREICIWLTPKRSAMRDWVSSS